MALDPLDALDAVDAADDRRDSGVGEEGVGGVGEEEEEKDVPKFSLRKEGGLGFNLPGPVKPPLFSKFFGSILRIEPENNKRPLSR